MADMKELGTTGLRRTGGFVIEDFLSQLQGIRGVRVYREMADNDPVVGAILFAIERVIQKLEWRVDSASDEKEDEENAEFIEECLHDMSDSWDGTLSNILSMLTFGWSFHEVVYKKRDGWQKDPRRRSKHNDGRIGWRKWAIRSQDTLWEWEFDEDGGIQGMTQIDPSATLPQRVFIPIDKALLFRTTTLKNNPEGRSLLRNAYRSWWYKRRIEEIEAVGIERDLAGLPVAHVPPEYLSSTATAEQRAVLAAIQDIVTGIKRNEQEGIIYPALYDDKGNRLFSLELMSSGGSRQFNIDSTISRYDQRIAMTLLSDFILLGHEKVGSFSLGTAKMDLWTVAVDAIAKSIAEVVNQHAIPRLLRLNGIDDSNPPFLTYGEVGDVDISQVGKYVMDLINSGVLTPDPKLESYMRDLAGLPASDPNAPEQMPMGGMPPQPGTGFGMEPMGEELPDVAPDEFPAPEDLPVLTAEDDAPEEN
jgi:hypothetical protein